MNIATNGNLFCEAKLKKEEKQVLITITNTIHTIPPLTYNLPKSRRPCTCRSRNDSRGGLATVRTLNEIIINFSAENEWKRDKREFFDFINSADCLEASEKIIIRSLFIIRVRRSQSPVADRLHGSFGVKSTISTFLLRQ